MQDWQSKYYDDEPEKEELSPLNIKRVKVMIELEVMADVSKHNTHQIVLCHPDMDGQLTFEVDSLEHAEDVLDEYENEILEDEVVEPEPIQAKPYVPQYTIPERVKYIEPEPPKPQPKLHFEPNGPITNDRPRVEPRVEATEVPIKKPGLPITPVEDNPVVSIISDVMEITDLFGKLSPKFKKFVDKHRK